MQSESAIERWKFMCDLLVIKIIHHPFVLNGLILQIKPDKKTRNHEFASAKIIKPSLIWQCLWKQQAIDKHKVNNWTNNLISNAFSSFSGFKIAKCHYSKSICVHLALTGYIIPWIMHKNLINYFAIFSLMLLCCACVNVFVCLNDQNIYLKSIYYVCGKCVCMCIDSVCCLCAFKYSKFLLF